MADFLEEAFPVENQVTPETPIVPEVAPEIVAEAPPPEPVAPEPVEPQQDGRFVPLAAVLDERDKRKALEARIAEFERNQQAQPQTAPDPFDDPTGFRDSVKAEIRLEMSDRFARQKYGDDDTQKAIDWAMERAQADPSIAISFARQADPVGWLVQQHRQQGIVSQIGDKSMDDFVRDYLAQNPGIAATVAPATAAPVIPTIAATPAVKPVAPPASIASQISQSAPIQSDPVAEFNAIFDRK